MAQFWAVTCKSCGAEIGLEEYSQPGAKGAQWHLEERIKCPNPKCGREHLYEREDFHLSDGAVQP